MSWITTHCVLVSDTGAGLVPFDLFEYQKDVVRAFWAYRELIILKARQLGMTELMSAIALYCVSTFPNWTVIVLSRGETEAREFLRKCRIAYDHLPDTVRVPLRDVSLSSSLDLANGSRIIPKPTTAGSGRGLNAQLLILDEWAHQQGQEQVYAAASPVARSAGNRIVGLSTANGAGNFFARQWQLAHDGEGMHPIFLPWDIRPGRDDAWYAMATQGYTDWQRAQEFPRYPEEAFILSGRPRFDIECLRALLATTQDPITTDFAGGLAIWEHPREGARYVIGADTAEGLPSGDFSAAVVLDYETGLDVAALHGHWSSEEFADLLMRVGLYYHTALLGVERNNHGHAVLLALTSVHGYPALYSHVDYDAVGMSPKVGWPTNAKTKPIMIDSLSQTFVEGRPWRNGALLDEALHYVITDTGSTAASGATHDDLVMAYAIAERLRSHIQPVVQTVHLDDYLDYRVRIARR